jgi:outer membrane protein OmpA-like peptidoglycan-associated protein
MLRFDFAIFLLLFFAFTFKSLAQPKRCLVKGKVTSYLTKQTISSGLTFQKEPDQSLTVVARSGPNGYKANLFERGLYVCLVAAEGFVSEHCEFDLEADSLKDKAEFQINFELIPIKLGEVLPFRKILFDVTNYQISKDALPELLRLKSMLDENPEIKIRLEGYTDNNSKGKKNIQLAKKRVESVKKWLIFKGINGKRIKIKAVGGEHQISAGDGPEGRRANRRVEVRVVEM